MSNVGLNEDIDEVADVCLSCGTLNNDEDPRIEGFSVRKKELLATEIPTTSSARIDLAARELDLRVGKKTGCRLCRMLAQSRNG